MSNLKIKRKRRAYTTKRYQGENNVFVVANKPNTIRTKTGFILYASDSPPLNSRIKEQGLNFFSTLGLIASIKNILQNIRKNIAPSPLILFCRKKIILIPQNEYCNILLYLYQ